jgi:hypothetical protein
MHALRAAADFRADRGLFDGGDGLTPSKHNGVIDVTSLSTRTISGGRFAAWHTFNGTSSPRLRKMRIL